MFFLKLIYTKGEYILDSFGSLAAKHLSTGGVKPLGGKQNTAVFGLPAEK